MIKDYVVFDLETTGLSPEKDVIIEIGALKVIQGKVADRFSEFINPHQPLSDTISSLTGITDDMLAGARDLQPVVSDFVNFSEGFVVIGHNLTFDYRFTKKAAAQFGLPFEREGIDTLKIAKNVHKDLPSRSLGALCDHYGIVNSSAHRAYHDALATAKLYQTLAHYFENSHPKLFVPEKMLFKEKKQQPMTKKQKAYLKDLCKYHKIEFNSALEQMTMSEASRWIDQTISKYGRMQRF
jgi:DNA polymerase-3 subunit alpha (Gram-positive type)